MKKSLLIYIFSLACFQLLAQSNRELLNIKSPQAQNLIDKVELSPSLDIGRINVNIPIYNFVAKDINVPLNLSYSSGGVRPNEHPGWVGMGWNLSADMVTRKINGARDESLINEHVFQITGNNSSLHLFSDIIPTSYMLINAPHNYDPGEWYNSILDKAQTNDTYRGDYSFRTRDFESDEYFFSAGSYSGSFVISGEGASPEAIVKGHPEIKVDLYYRQYPLAYSGTVAPTLSNNEFTYLSYYGSYGNILVQRQCVTITGFEIKTPDGLVYEYGAQGQDIGLFAESSADFFSDYNFEPALDSWYLRKITSNVTGETVSFQYERKEPTLQLSLPLNISNLSGGITTFGYSQAVGNTTDPNDVFKLQGTLTCPYYLKSIESNETRLEFFSSRSKELRYNFYDVSIALAMHSKNYNRDDESNKVYLESRFPIGAVRTKMPGVTGNPAVKPISTEVFQVLRYDNWIETINYANFQWHKLDSIKLFTKSNSKYIKDWKFSYSDNLQQRLTLLRLKESDKSKPHIFSYIEGDLPNYLTPEIDHWGYYNHNNSLVKLSPFNSTAKWQEYADARQPNSNYIYAGLLNKINFPLGGYKTFNFEPNSYKKIVNRNSTTGNFEIENLTTTTEGGGVRVNAIESYLSNDQLAEKTVYEYGDGLLNSKPRYFWLNMTGQITLDENSTYSSSRFSANSLIPTIENRSGAVVTYQDVTEKNIGKGYSTYKFSSFITNPDIENLNLNVNKTIYSPTTSRAMERSQLLEKKIYSDLLPNKPISIEKYDYSVNPGLANFNVRSVEVTGARLFTDQSNLFHVIEGSAYLHSLYPYQLNKKTVQNYDYNNDSYVTNTEKYKYDEDSYGKNYQSSTYNDNMLKEIKIDKSNGDIFVKNYRHAFDYLGAVDNNATNEQSKSIFNLQVLNRSNQLLSEETKVIKSGTTNALITGANFISYKLGPSSSTNVSMAMPAIFKEYKLQNTSPLVTLNNTINNTTFTLDPSFKEVTEYKLASNYNIVELKENLFKKQTFIWRGSYLAMVASFQNASYGEATFVDFEEIAPVYNSQSFGGVAFYGASLNTTNAAFGSSSMSLLNGGVINFGTLELSKTYVASFWYKSSSNSEPGNGFVLNSEPAINGWKKYTKTFNGASNFFFSPTASCDIDNLVIMPIDSQMETYTYKPLVGITSRTDAKGMTTYYDYDSFGRFKSLRDQNGNVVKGYRYHYAGQ